ncbi:MAG: ribonuclease III domain-containing protein [Gaiellales bacterium]
MRRLLDELPADLRSLALTHPAFAPTRGQSYERLEFLGDSVLGLVITEELYRRWPELPEGELTRVRAGTVSRDACAQVAHEAGLGEAMVAEAAGRGAAAEASAQRLSAQRNTLAALVESVVGAAHIAHGYEAIARHVLAVFEDRIAYAFKNRVDARSRLQELAAKTGAAVSWTEVGEDGPPHDRRFTARVQLGDVGTAASTEALSADGTGRSKQEAQQAASAALLVIMEDQG